MLGIERYIIFLDQVLLYQTYPISSSVMLWYASPSLS